MIVLLHSFSWLYGFSRSKLLNHNSTIFLFDSCNSILSINSCILSIWYLMLKVLSFTNFEQRANFLHCLFLHDDYWAFKAIFVAFFQFDDVPSFSTLFNSVVTFSNKWGGTLLPLVWIGLKEQWKSVVFLSNGIFPTLVKRPLNCVHNFRVLFLPMSDLHMSGS